MHNHYSTKCPTCGQTLPLQLDALPDAVTLGRDGRRSEPVTYERRGERWIDLQTGHQMDAEAFERYLVLSGLATAQTAERPRCEHGLPAGCCKVCATARKRAEMIGGGR